MAAILAWYIYVNHKNTPACTVTIRRERGNVACHSDVFHHFTLPSHHRLQLQMHSSLRLHRQGTVRDRHLVWVRHGDVERAAEHRDQDLEFGLGEVLADTASRPVEEGHDVVVASGTASVVRAACLLVDPSLRHEFCGIRAPVLLGAVDGPGDDRHAGSLGNAL